MCRDTMRIANVEKQVARADQATRAMAEAGAMLTLLREFVARARETSYVELITRARELIQRVENGK